LIKQIIIEEKNEEVERTKKEYKIAKVAHIFGDTVTFESDSTTQEGAIIGQLKENVVQPIGAVFEGGREFSVNILDHENTRLVEGDKIKVCECTNLLSYDLQLELLSKITSPDLRVVEQKAFAALFDKQEAKPVVRIEISNKRDVKDEYDLDESQIDAVKAIVGMKENDLLIIVGPPGTGKTQVIAKATKELWKRGERILVTSHTNRAVDNVLELLNNKICLRVTAKAPHKVSEKIVNGGYLLSYKATENLGLEFKTLTDEIKELREKRKELIESSRELSAVGEPQRKYSNAAWYPTNDYELKEKNKQLLGTINKELKEKIEQRAEILSRESARLIKETKIIGTTLIRSQIGDLADEVFDVAIIDEASQVLITLALLGMIKAKKWVIVGDDKQLLPILRGKTAKNNTKYAEALSAFSCFRKKYENSRSDELNRVLTLRWHYRSHPKIFQFAKDNVYLGKIEISPKINENEKELVLSANPPFEFLDPKFPAVFVDVCGSECKESRGGSRYNVEEVQAICSIVKILKWLGVRSEDIGVIAPYRAQQKKLKEDLKDEKIEVYTVDSFQGREADVIIFSVTSTDDLGFVEEKHRVNVALTRAIKKLIVVGNGKSISGTGLLAKYVDYCKTSNSYFPYEVDDETLKQIESQLAQQRNKNLEKANITLQTQGADLKKVRAYLKKHNYKVTDSEMRENAKYLGLTPEKAVMLKKLVEKEIQSATTLESETESTKKETSMPVLDRAKLLPSKITQENTQYSSSLQQKILDILLRGKSISKKELMRILNISPETLKAEIDKLTSTGKSTGKYTLECSAGYCLETKMADEWYTLNVKSINQKKFGESNYQSDAVHVRRAGLADTDRAGQ
jgi:hypothetical protein